MIAISLLLGVASLGACSHAVDCSGGAFQGGCVPGTAAANPPPANAPVAAPATPAPILGVTVRTAPSAVAPAPAAVSLGDPSQFAGEDDRQCRSYGLKFGTHDYADCRLRLSAQHRGLDPNTGAAPAR